MQIFPGSTYLLIHSSIHPPTHLPLTHLSIISAALALAQPDSGPGTSPGAGGTGVKTPISCPQGAHRVESKE